MTRSVAIIGTRGYPSYYGGFETAVRRIAPHLAEHGWDVTVYGRPGSTKTDDPGLDPRVVSRQTRGIESKSLSTLSYGLTACLDAARRKPDVALVMNVANGFWLPLLKARGIPTLVNVDGIEWDRAKWGRAAKAMFRAGAKMTAMVGDELLFDAEAIGERWRRDFGRDGVFVPYGGDVPPELPVKEGLTHRGYILVVARFVPENSIGEFMDATETLSARWPIVIVGSTGYGGELDDRAKALSDSSPNIHWLGHVSDDRLLLSLWRHAGVYFHGHSVGGTNPALVQAMACGIPIVARDTVYNREVLGSNAVFTSPNPEAIAANVDALMADPVLQERFATAVQERAISDYSWQSVCDRYEDALLTLIREPVRR
ncbi:MULTISPECIES: glycosyltransferase [unclassified Rathayibacter]|uniref:glycosyltransferase n=1 Tax=unclassified Rathayibacter TaxID=2609250 RepID=UPI00188C753E|nr:MULTISPECIES: glycosyltransferase [unclassified Rathayibacter]MBF4463525.1 glycosyltransferase [Rathayibacter sp. VKM Ac-2879]MBF4504753.1 glycosyltransferase [Rathayibacter sp. VKM Ac-2878]